MSVSYDRLAERIDDLIFELSLINSELNELRKKVCLLEKQGLLKELCNINSINSPFCMISW